MLRKFDVLEWIFEEVKEINAMQFRFKGEFIKSTFIKNKYCRHQLLVVAVQSI